MKVNALSPVTGARSPIGEITIPEGARAVLVAREGDGINVTPIVQGESVLNIRRDLLVHLNEAPYSTEWLTILRDYCDSKIAARAQAHAAGAIITPSATFNWDMTTIEQARGAA